MNPIFADKQQKLSFLQKISYASGIMGFSMPAAIIMGWLLYFWADEDPSVGKSAFVSAAAFGTIQLIGRVVDAISDPLIGHWSDHTRTRFGRRIPFIIGFTPMLAASFALMWFPPADAPGMTNNVYLSVLGSLFWIAFTGVVAPYLSLLPEITPFSGERLKTSEIMAYFEVLSMIVGTVVVGQVIEAGKDGGLSLAGIGFANGFTFLAVIVAVAMCLIIPFSVAFVRENPYSESKNVQLGLVQSMKETFRNPAFPPYVISVSFFRIGVDVIVAAIPFLVTKVLFMGEAVAGALQGVIVLLAAALFPLVSWLSNKYGKRLVYLAGQCSFGTVLPLVGLTTVFPVFGYLLWPILQAFGVSFEHPESGLRFSHSLVVFILATFAVATSYVLPRAIYSDVIDHDEKRTGFRREAMYNGMEGLITKFAAGLAMILLTQLFAWFGSTVDNNLGVLLAGPVAGVLLFLGFIAFLKYPFKD